MKIRFFLAVALTAVVLSVSAQEQMSQDWCENLEKKFSLDNQIEGCTEIIQAGSANESTRNLAVALYNRGNGYSGKGQHDRAIEDYSESIRLEPTSANAFYNRGKSFSDKGEYDRAIEDYSEAIRLDPTDANSFYNRALTYSKLGEHDQVIEDYSEVIRQNPKDDEAINNRGVAYFLKGQHDRAMEDFNEVIRLDPNDPVAFGNRGNAYVSKGQFLQAIDDYNAALSKNPEPELKALALYGRGYAKEKTGDTGGSEADMAAAKAIDAGVAELYAALLDYVGSGADQQ